jgi:hypothetical protein
MIEKNKSPQPNRGRSPRGTDPERGSPEWMRRMASFDRAQEREEFLKDYFLTRMQQIGRQVLRRDGIDKNKQRQIIEAIRVAAGFAPRKKPSTRRTPYPNP